MSAKKGEIKQQDDGTYQLVLNKADVNHVIMFSDRPNRVVKYITAQELSKVWKTGANSFQQDPPNAVLSGMGIPTQIVILNGVQVDGNTVTYPIAISKDEKHMFGELKPASVTDVTLTIDNQTAYSHAMFCIQHPSTFFCRGNF